MCERCILSLIPTPVLTTTPVLPHTTWVMPLTRVAYRDTYCICSRWRGGEVGTSGVATLYCCRIICLSSTAVNETVAQPGNTSGSSLDKCTGSVGECTCGSWRWSSSCVNHIGAGQLESRCLSVIIILGGTLVTAIYTWKQPTPEEVQTLMHL